jgi:DNA (cytosine-5)-methyltransferase 1
LVMHLPTRQYDNRPASVQGLEEVQLREMIRKREIVVTSKPYPMLSFRDSIIPLYLAGMSARDQKFAIFHEWPLVCRKVWNTTTWPNGKVYGSVIRSFYPSELPPPQPTTRAEEYDAHELPTPSVKNEKNPPTKKTRYTFLDICCGAGGASQGAKDAGLQLLGGLDKDDLAIEAWEENFPEGLPLHMDMHDVISLSRDIIRRVDILWFSISCQAFSPSQ